MTITKLNSPTCSGSHSSSYRSSGRAFPFTFFGCLKQEVLGSFIVSRTRYCNSVGRERWMKRKETGPARCLYEKRNCRLQHTRPNLTHTSGYSAGSEFLVRVCGVSNMLTVLNVTGLYCVLPLLTSESLSTVRPRSPAVADVCSS